MEYKVNSAIFTHRLLCAKINLVDSRLLNRDTMHVILDKVFFDQIKN